MTAPTTPKELVEALGQLSEEMCKTADAYPDDVFNYEEFEADYANRAAALIAEAFERWATPIRGVATVSYDRAERWKRAARRLAKWRDLTLARVQDLIEARAEADNDRRLQTETSVALAKENEDLRKELAHPILDATSRLVISKSDAEVRVRELVGLLEETTAVVELTLEMLIRSFPYAKDRVPTEPQLCDLIKRARRAIEEAKE